VPRNETAGSGGKPLATPEYMRLSAFVVASALAAATSSSPAAAQPYARPAPATIAFRSDLPGTFHLERVRILVDGAVRYEGLRPARTSIAPGAHLISVIADYRMHDPLLSYARDYTFRVQSAHRVRAAPGGVVVARAVEVGGVTRPVGQRIHIVWR
jgi:hypothetical protein